MARLDFFTGEGAVNSPAHIRPANNGSFPLIDAHDVQVGSNPTDADDRLDATLEDIDAAINTINSELGSGSSDTNATIKKRLAAAETNIGKKVNTSDIQTTVRAAASASDSKIPSEKAVRSAIDNATVSTTATPASGSTAAFSAGGAYTELAKKVNKSDIQSTVNTSSNPPSSNAVKTYVDAADALKINTNDIQTTVRAAASASDSKVPSEKAVRSAIDSKTITIDTTVTEGSANAVSGGAVYTALSQKQGTLSFDDVPTANSNNPVKSGGIKTALDNKMNTMTVDSTPTANSNNLVTSGGVKAAIDTVVSEAEAAAQAVADDIEDDYTAVKNDLTAKYNALHNGMVVAATAAAMTNTDYYYIYTGSESGYTNGHWYYHNGTAWVDGGAVGGVSLDTSLTIAGAAADAKATGDTITSLSNDIDTVKADLHYRQGKYVAFGDSIVWGSVWSPIAGTNYHRVREEWRIPTRIAIANGFAENFSNEGIGGIGYLKKQDGQNLIEQIAEYDFTGVDLVTIQAGGNDKVSYELGTSADAFGAETICGAIRNIIEIITEANPKTQIIIIQPTPSLIDGTVGDIWFDGPRWSLDQFNIEVSKLCNEEHIGYVNWMESVYVRNWANVGYHGEIGPNYSHPTVDYDYCLLGDFIAGKISALGEQKKENPKVSESTDAVLCGGDVGIRWHKNVGIHVNNGRPIRSTGYSTTDFIRLPQNATAVINTFASHLRYAIYDEDFNVIQVYNHAFGINIQISGEGVCYFKIMYNSVTDTDLETVKVHFEYSDGIARASEVDKRLKDTNNNGYSNELASASGNPIVLHDATHSKLDAITISDEAEGEVLSACGKNLFNFQHKSRLGLVSNGVTFNFDIKKQEYTIISAGGATSTAVSANDTCVGCLTLNGVAAFHNFHFRFPVDTLITITPGYSYEPYYDDKIELLLMWVEDGTIKSMPIGYEGATIIAKAGVEYGIRLRVAKGWKGQTTIKPQIEIGDEGTTFEQYRGVEIPLPLSAGSNLFNMPKVSRLKSIPNTYVTATFDYINQSILIESTGPESNTLVTNNSYDGKVNNKDWFYLSKFTPGAMPVLVPGVPEELVGMIAILVSDGTNYVVSNTTTAPIVFQGEAGKEYGYRIRINAGAKFTYRFAPVISTGIEILKQLGTYYPVTSYYTNGSAAISVTYGKTKLYDAISAAVRVANGLNTLTAGKIVNPLSRLQGVGPFVTFIDDDTTNPTLVQRFHDILAAEDVVGNYAVELRNVENYQDALPQMLLDYEQEGFGMLYHCYKQAGDADRYWESGNTMYDETLIRQNFYHGLRAYKQLGLNSSRYWVTPYGVNDEFIRGLAKEADMECLLSCPTSTYTCNAVLSLGSNFYRYNLPRWIFLSGANNDYQGRAIIDGCAETRGWLIIVTHVNSWPAAMIEQNTQRLTALIQYAKTAGCEVKNFIEAYQTFKPLLMLNELF